MSNNNPNQDPGIPYFVGQRIKLFIVDTWETDAVIVDVVRRGDDGYVAVAKFRNGFTHDIKGRIRKH